MEKNHDDVQIISSSLVPMATNANSMSRLELTPWDLQFLLLDPIQKGILFHKPLDCKTINIIQHLKNTLSHTLDYFPPLAGRFGTNGENPTCFFLDCNNAGAEFTHAVAGDVSVSEILEAKYIPRIVSSLFPLNDLMNCELGISKPLLGVQVTELSDGYFVSCTGCHSVIDGSSFWHFFNSWSEISRGFDKISKPPVFERCNFNLPIYFSPLEQNISPNFNFAPLLESVFHFSKENVINLKARANFEAGTDKISSLQAVSAHLWRSVVRCRHFQSSSSSSSCCDENADVFIGMLVGARARFPLAEGYFGNAVYVGGSGIGRVEMLENGLGHAAMRINEFVARQTGESARKYVEDWVENPVILKRGGRNFVVSSSPRHNVYGNDFGWGRPIGVRSGKGQKFDGKMTVFPAAVAGGIDVEVCLAPETMRALEVDEEFIQALNS